MATRQVRKPIELVTDSKKLSGSNEKGSKKNKRKRDAKEESKGKENIKERRGSKERHQIGKNN